MSKIVFNGTAYRLHGDLPTIGSKAPDVSLVNIDLQDVSLANFHGKRKIINTMPSIDLCDCEKSVIEFDRLALKYSDIAMLVVSYDLPFAHARFNTGHGLDAVTSLSAIRHAGFGNNYGVLIVEGPLSGMFAPAVVVLDENNTVVYREQIEDICREPDYTEACRALGISPG
ncbi:MAG: thiol peroxidase [Woeseia sp.]